MNPRSLLLLFLALTGCSSSAPSQAVDPIEIENVSLIQLIASPERYEGKLVRVHGFIRLEFEGNAIYLHREDFEHHLYSNGLWLNAGNCVARGGKNIDTGYALVEGKFTSSSRGHMGLWAGEIQDVQRCVEMP